MDDHASSLYQEKKWIEASKREVSNFKPLYNKYYEVLFRFFVRRTDDEALSHELCSDTFFKALDNLANYEWQDKPFGAWLFRIATNELRKHFRGKKLIYVIEEDKLDCLAMEEELHLDYQPHLVKSLDQLNDLELRLLELRFFEELDFKEISRLLDMGESATKMRIYRLLSKLKSLIIESHDKA